MDPLEYRLVFERFLNVERKEMPDIDMDFQDDRRDEVLSYVTQKYGRDKVAQIITFGTLGAKASLRDVGRGLGMGYSDVDRVARLVPFKSRTLDDALAASSEMKEIYEEDEAIRKLVDTARALEGTVHHVSTHAAGVVISSELLTEYVPLQRPVRGDENSEIFMTQYAMEPVAHLGLLKMDFLGLTSLTILDRVVKLVEKTKGIKIELNRLSLDDNTTFGASGVGKDLRGVPARKRWDAAVHQRAEAHDPRRYSCDDSPLPARAYGAHRDFYKCQARPHSNKVSSPQSRGPS